MKNKVKSYSSLRSVVFYLFLLLSDQSCVSARDKSVREWEKYEWRMINGKKTNSLGGIAYSRKVKGSEFKEFKVVGEIEVTPERAVQVLREKNENSEKYLDEKTGYINVLHSTEDELLTYSVYRLPFPFRDRAMCERFLLFEDKEKGIHKIAWKQEWDHAPMPEKGVIRMPVARGSWEFVPIGSGRSRATYTVYVDPGGNMPAAMFNRIVAKGLPEELRGIEEIAHSLK